MLFHLNFIIAELLVLLVCSYEGFNWSGFILAANAPAEKPAGAPSCGLWGMPQAG